MTSITMIMIMYRKKTKKHCIIRPHTQSASKSEEYLPIPIDNPHWELVTTDAY